MSRKFSVFSQSKTVVLFTILFLSSIIFVSAQETENKEEKKETPTPVPVQPNLDPSKNLTAEAVAESVIYIYGGLSGRNGLNQIRKTTSERGKMTIVNADGTIDKPSYQRWVIRGESLEKEKIRFEQEFPSTKYSLVYDGANTFGIYNNTKFEPRESAINTFQHQIWHGLEALLRYKENDSKLELAGRDKIMGVDFYIVDVTDKQNRKTKFYVSVKTFRVMMLEYEEVGVKYKRKFYDYNYSQGTLVPYRTVLWADDKQIEETSIMTITFGQKVEDNMFAVR
ncbi:hypothetical protein BH20ACI4_BH20ACI4_05070 [soil metagenome]